MAWTAHRHAAHPNQLALLYSSKVQQRHPPDAPLTDRHHPSDLERCFVDLFGEQFTLERYLIPVSPTS